MTQAQLRIFLLIGFIILSASFLSILVIITIINCNRKNKQFKKASRKQLKKELLNNIDKDIQNLKEYYRKEKIRLEGEYEQSVQKLTKINETLSELQKKGQDNIQKELDAYRSSLIKTTEMEIEKQSAQKVEEYQNLYNNIKEELDEQLKHRKEQVNEYCIQADLTIKQLEEEISDYRLKREVINKQILMERERKEKESFYSIVINEVDKEDLQLITTFQDKIHNKEALNRVIFDLFIKKPMNEMIKRVLEGRSPSGIYMITNLLTNEIYIGRAVSVDKRWQEHCKSCFSIGTIAHSALHTKMAKDGIWNFSFQLLEEVPKEKLSEREKYWINFYQTKEYGMNERAGG